jgi:hypothetical protein
VQSSIPQVLKKLNKGTIPYVKVSELNRVEEKNYCF